MKVSSLIAKVSLWTRAELLDVQTHLIEGLPVEWNVDLDENGIQLSHPKMPGQVVFGPVDYIGISGVTTQQVERQTVNFYKFEGGINIISAACRSVKALSITVRLKNLTDAFKAICLYCGSSSIAELSQNPAMLDDICGYLEDVRPHVET